MSQIASRNAELYHNFLRNLAKVNKKHGAWYELHQRGSRDAEGQTLSLASGQQSETLEISETPETPLDNVTVEELPSPYVNDVPLPRILTRHLLRPSDSLQDNGGVVGYRIIASARVGAKTGSLFMHKGRIGAKSYDLANVDYGKAHYVEKLGVQGLKSWVSFKR